ncbi:MAG: DUF4147 domain-containing protein [Acidobacteria bacterium]|nr:DUF4147 domain-containing protein [Acidobacteriota bacterium]
MTAKEARELVRNLFLRTLPHLQVGPKMKQMVRLRDGALQIGGDRIPLHEGRPVRVVAMGKAAIEMTHTLREILPDIRLRGVVAAPEDPRAPLAGFEYYKGGHPYPNDQSWRAAEAALSLLDQRNVTEDDLVIFLISGGGSSMLELLLDPIVSRGGYPLPASPIVSIEELRQFYEVLVTCGANIQEINTVRKHFSAVKGGRLAHAAWPARQVTLYVSDVPEHLPSMVASGPSLPDESTGDECFDILARHSLFFKLPASFRPYWNEEVPETPKPGDPYFERSLYYCLLSNSSAVEKLAELAEDAGIIVETDSRCDDWNFQKAADYLLDMLRAFRRENPGKPVAIISGGELSCPVTGDGTGGRNQAFVLDCVGKIVAQPIIVLSAGTDGIDGNSPAAGAIADGESLSRARVLGMDPEEFQRRSDSFHFFEKLGDTIMTGPTGTNVRDLRFLLAYE